MGTLISYLEIEDKLKELDYKLLNYNGVIVYPGIYSIYRRLPLDGPLLYQYGEDKLIIKNESLNHLLLGRHISKDILQ